MAPATVIVNPKGDILFVSGRTNRYLEAAPGAANWNLFAMAHDGLRHTLGEAVRAAVTQEEPIIRKDVHVGLDDPALTVDLKIQSIRDPESLRGLVLVVFSEPPASTKGKRSSKRARRAGPVAEEMAENLAQLRVELQSTREDMQSSAEELHSANEEFQSANEELQSTNEELTTAQEETQSMNEELQTLNHELQAKVDDLTRVSNDMKNLLESTDIATLFLDAKLRVRLFTAGSSQIFRLIPSDVKRPIADFASALDYPALVADAQEVLRTLTVHEQRAASRDGRWFMVRIMPYRTLDNMVEGVAITFADITASTVLEERLRATQTGLELHIEDQAAQLQRAIRRPEEPPQ